MDDRQKAEEIKKKALEVRPRQSLFDSFLDVPWTAADAGFKGLYMLLIYLITVGIGIEALTDLSLKGSLFESGLLYMFLHELQYVFTCWVCLSLYSSTAFLLQKGLLWGLPITAGKVIQHCTQSVMFIVLFVVILRNNWFVSHNLFLGMTACILFFKMHSYTSVNISLREEYLRTKPQSTSGYPNNITLKNFTYFMVLPTFVYQPKYPLSSKRRITYMLIKAILFIFAFAKAYQITTNYILAYSDQYKESQITFFEMYLRQLLPLGVLLLMLIVMIFDFCCTFFAELFRYPDHQFYEDFWNSTTMNEFLVKMNCLIPNFFKVHLVHMLVTKHNVKLKYAKVISFMFAAALLEMLMVFIFKSTRPYFFVLILVNYPVYKYVTWFKDRYVGNFLFLTLFATLGPFVICLYIRDFLA